MSVRCEECHESWPYSDTIPNCCDCANLVWNFPWHDFWVQIAIAALLQAIQTLYVGEGYVCPSNDVMRGLYL